MVSVKQLSLKTLFSVIAIVLAGCSAPAKMLKDPEPVLMPEASPYTQREDAQGSLLNEAWQALSEGRLDDADIWLGRAIRVNPTNPEIYYHMALLRQQQGLAEQARQLAGRAKSLGPNPGLERKLQHLILSLVEPQS